MFKKQTESCLEGHTQNVSAHNYILELNNCTTCEKMTEIKQVNVSVCSLSFCFFFSPDRWVSEQGGTGRVFFLFVWFFLGGGGEGDVITLKPNGLRQIDAEL